MKSFCDGKRGQVRPPCLWRQELGTKLELACEWLANDRQMGAGTLARAAARELIKLIRLTASQPWHEAIEILTSAAERLRQVRPTMAAPVNLLADSARAMASANDAQIAMEHIDNLILQSQEAESQVSLKAASLVAPGSTLMTISYSSTVLRALRAAAPHVTHVYVCEGRPLMEGRHLAAQLHAEGVAVTLLTDAQALLIMPHVDAVLLGADAILPDGSAVNKVGSAQLALAANHYHKPVWVAADRLKFVREASTEDVVLERQPGSEVWAEAPKGLTISNIYFETIPADMIDTLICESGRVN